MKDRIDGLRVMWDRTPFPLTQTTGAFAPHAANNIVIVAKKPRAQDDAQHVHQLQAVYVGSGPALDRLIDCAGREDILQHSDPEHELIAFSCFVGESVCEGTERFLANDLAPLVSGRTPNALSYRINLPAVPWTRPGANPAPLRKAG